MCSCHTAAAGGSSAAAQGARGGAGVPPPRGLLSTPRPWAVAPGTLCAGGKGGGMMRVFRPLCSASPSRNAAFTLLLALCAKIAEALKELTSRCPTACTLAELCGTSQHFPLANPHPLSCYRPLPPVSSIQTPEALRELASLLLPLHFASVEHELPSWEYLPSCAPRPRVGYAGLKNAGATCYMNSVFQQLFMQPQVRRALLAFPETPESDRPLSVIYQVQAIFSYLLAGCPDYFVPEGFWDAFRDYDGQPVNLREHQDAFEFFNRLYDSLDESMKAQRHSPTLTSIFGGHFAQQIICRGCPHRSEREEPFAAVSVDVKGKRGLQESLEAFVQGDLLEADNAYFCGQCGKKESLEAFVQGDLLEADNAYFCGQCGKKVDALKRACIKTLPPTLIIHLKCFDFDYETMQRLKLKHVLCSLPLLFTPPSNTSVALLPSPLQVDALKRACIKTLPPTLIIHLKRFDFDYETMQRLKLKDRFTFPLSLNMRPFTREGLAQKEREQRRGRVGGAEGKEEGRDEGGELEQGREEGEGEDKGGESVKESREDRVEGAVEEKGAGGGEERSDGYYEYSLVGVVVHSGTAFAGHYYSYIKERSGDSPLHHSRPSQSVRSKQRWLCFDDKRVEAYDVRELEKDCFGGKYSAEVYDNLIKTSSPQEFDRPNSAYMLFYERIAPTAAAATSTTSAAPVAANTTASTTATGGAANTAATAEGMRATGEAPAAAAAAETAAGAPTITTTAITITPCTAAEERADGAVEPYSIPPSIHHCVWQDNLRFQQESRLLDQTYFRFLLQLARVNLDVFQMCHDRGKMAALSDARAGGVKASPQRSEALRVERAAEETAEALLSLLLPFLFRVYLRAHASLRTEDPLWTDVLSRMLDANSTACRLFNACMAGNRRWLLLFLLKCPINAISVAVADLLVTSCHSATCFLNARTLVPAAALPTATPAAAVGGALEGSAGDAAGVSGTAGAAGGVAGAGAAGGDALNVDALIDSLVSLLRDASAPSCHVDNLCSILVEYARIGPTQRLSLIRRQLPATCLDYLDRVGIAAAAKLHLSPLHSLLSILIRSCYPRPPPSRRPTPASTPASAGDVGGNEEGEGEGDEGEGEARAHGRGRRKGEGRLHGREEKGKGKAGQGGGERRRGYGGASAGAAGAAGAVGEVEEEGGEEEDAGLQNPAFFGRPVAVLPPRVAQLAADPDYITSNLDNQNTVSLLLYISFGNESESITVLREAMSSLQRAAVTSSRRILSLLLHLLKLPDALQEARQESVVNGCQFFRPGVFDLLLAKQVSPLKRYALLKFLLATAAFSTMSRRHIAVRRADLSAVLQWLQEETANAPGHDLSNEELPSGTLRRTATVDSTIATGLSLISLPHEPNA
ncbi:unnamed protein product [Closterium sp. NIES-65]|nr:unnamed protein product [Closterium sp. NIES-65]